MYKIRLKNLVPISFSIIFLFCMNSCSTISYSPKVSLDVSEKTIDKKCIS